jgi:gamma-glutamyltranspeptidase/glutathione hydrolase
MVASPHYLATQAGVAVLRRGGSAVDAAIATNAVLAVVTPYSCGLGGDLFALVYNAGDGGLAGLNSSGRAAADATLERVRSLAGDRMPARGPLTVTVPGCVAGWEALHQRYGRLPFADLLADAICYAGDGFPVSAAFAGAIERSVEVFHPDTPARETFLPNGEAPREGQMFRYTALAGTLRAIAEGGAAAFYRGAIGQEIVRSLRAVGGLLCESDLADHRADWVEPLSVRYRDVDVYELPPNSQGIVALMILNLLTHVPSDGLASGGEEYVHLVSEAARLAYADRQRYIGDPDAMAVPPDLLLSDEYARRRARLIGEQAGHASFGQPGETIYLCAADADGNAVSLIESNFSGIGSGVMAGSTGIMLQNRGSWFSLDPGHVNVIAPRKRTLHTLMPGMAFRGARPWLVFGTMGGSAQAQIHVEVLTRLIDQHMALDEAIAAPRFDAVPVPGVSDGPPVLLLEGRFPNAVVEGLSARGNSVRVLEPFTSAMGHAHAVEVLEDGVYVGAADPRTESLAVGY